MNELEALAAIASRLARASEGYAQTDRANRLAGRLAQRRFLVSVVGEFKRGKSTLINALLGEPVVPTGALPLTAVPTEVVYGDSSAVVEFLDGSRSIIDPSGLADYVTEAGNPRNSRGVVRVELRGRWPLLETGVVLVDTPGTGSLHTHNTDVARTALADADGAILVMAADAPISEHERRVLAALSERRAPSFVVLNKVDHLTAVELDQVRRFVERVVAQELGTETRVFAVGARAALEALSEDRRFSTEAGEWEALTAELGRFIDRDLVGARLSTARRELARLNGALRDAISVELAANELEAATLQRSIEQFRSEASRQRQAFDDDCTLLDRDVTRLGEQVWERLRAFAETAAEGHIDRLASVAAAAPRGELNAALRAEIEAAVRESFDEFRQDVAHTADTTWQRLAAGFRQRTRERVDEVRFAAAALFDVPLPHTPIPTVGEGPERFSFLFRQVVTLDEPFARAFGRLVPARIARRRAALRARADLRAEFDKHAGRARADLVERLDGVRARFQAAMRFELDSVIDAITRAAVRAEQLRTEDETRRAEYVNETVRRLAIIADATAIIGEV